MISVPIRDPQYRPMMPKFIRTMYRIGLTNLTKDQVDQFETAYKERFKRAEEEREKL